MIKKLAFFLFACGLSAGYAYAATSEDVSQCRSRCDSSYVGCTNSLGGSPICRDLMQHCLERCNG
nr:hypothetical protein [uncultured Janthinobacterium sp.]